MLIRTFLLVMLLAAGLTCPGVAQRTFDFNGRDVPLQASSAVGRSEAPPALEPAHGLTVAGLVAGGVGFFAGGFAGAALETAGGCSGDFCGLAGFLFGAVVGESLALPLGVHLANGRRGKYGRSAGISMGIAAGGLLLVAAVSDANADLELPLLVSVPIAQLVSSIRIERRTTRVQP